MASRSCQTGCPRPCGEADAIPRRTFLTQSLLLTVATMLGSACSIDYPTPLEPSLAALGDKGFAVPLTDHPALFNVGAIAIVSAPGGVPVAIVRESASEFAAFWMSCPHQGATLVVEGDAFLCPNHLARFASDGSWVSGHSTGHLTAVPLVYDSVAGAIMLGVEPVVPTPRPRAPMTLTVTLASTPALATVGGIALFGYGNGYPAALVRVADAAYLALSPICTHRQYYVDVDVEHGGFLCPGHGAMFTERGQWTGGTATTNLTVLPSTFDAANGTVTITIP
jgi:Rieske Fe-S protein